MNLSLLRAVARHSCFESGFDMGKGVQTCTWGDAETLRNMKADFSEVYFLRFGVELAQMHPSLMALSEKVLNKKSIICFRPRRRSSKRSCSSKENSN